MKPQPKDRGGNGSANMVAFDTRNKPPVFVDQDTDTDGVQNTETTRKVEVASHREL